MSTLSSTQLRQAAPLQGVKSKKKLSWFLETPEEIGHFVLYIVKVVLIVWLSMFLAERLVSFSTSEAPGEDRGTLIERNPSGMPRPKSEQLDLPSRWVNIRGGSVNE